LEFVTIDLLFLRNNLYENIGPRTNKTTNETALPSKADEIDCAGVIGY